MADLDLTGRELQIVHFVWSGVTVKEIADALGITHGRVRNQLNQIYRKLNVTDGQELTALVHSRRIILNETGETKTQKLRKVKDKSTKNNHASVIMPT